VRHMVSIDFQQLPAQLLGMTYRTICIAKTAGVVCPYPLSESYGDGL
jgi:hypothetical protein